MKAARADASARSRILVMDNDYRPRRRPIMKSVDLSTRRDKGNTSGNE